MAAICSCDYRFLGDIISGAPDGVGDELISLSLIWGAGEVAAAPASLEVLEGCRDCSIVLWPGRGERSD